MKDIELDFYIQQAINCGFIVHRAGCNSWYQFPNGSQRYPLEALPFDLGYMALTTDEGTVFLDSRDFICYGYDVFSPGRERRYHVGALKFRGRICIYEHLAECSHHIEAAALRDEIRDCLQSDKAGLDIRTETRRRRGTFREEIRA